jgi:uncharacterized protein YecE (DUF72 family)
MAAPRIAVGTSGWSYGHWIGRFYPEALDTRARFSYYARRFDSVELNMSFYRYPREQQLRHWRENMPAGFTMTFKANRRISHFRKFRGVEKEVQTFYGFQDELGPHAGCILFQTPDSFRCTAENTNVLRDFLALLEPGRRNVFEFRHPSWWNGQTAELLREHGAAFCVVSGLGMPSEVITTAPFAYFRFHGPAEPYASRYSQEQLRSWAAAIQREIETHGLREVYCYFNNDGEGYAPENAAGLRELLG